MRAIPTSLQASLDSGATTLCRCWRIDRNDGVTLGFTDHDNPLNFDGVSFEASSGLNASAVEQSTGLSVDNHQVAGALQSDAITAPDIERGAYDGATVTAYLVDWSNPADRIVLSRGSVGQIRRSETAFEVEIVGLAERLNQAVGRAYLHSCDLRLGAPKCGVDLGLAAYRGAGGVIQVLDERRILVSGLQSYMAGWFSGGFLTWSSGANQGLDAVIKDHTVNGAEVLLELWLPAPATVLAGDALEAVAGCDKRLNTCRDKFGNLMNFRGFPHMPGDDWAASYPNSGGGHDGGSLFRS